MSLSLQNFYKATITRNWSATTGDFNVSVAPTVSPGYIVVSPNNSTLREIVYYTATGSNSYGDFITVATLGGRGVGETTAQTHTIGETVRMNLTAEHWDAMNDDIASIIAAGLPAGTEGEIMMYTGGAWTASDISSTSGVSAGPSSSSTQTITHGLGRTPKIIRLVGYGQDASTARTGATTGTYNTTGNRCVYFLTGTNAAPVTSTAYAIYLSWFSGTERHASGVVQNVTSTTFDIVWTNSNDVSSNTSFIWEAM